MQRKSWATTAAVAGSLALGLVFGSAAYDGVANAQTASPSDSAAASVTPSASATASLRSTHRLRPLHPSPTPVRPSAQRAGR